MSKILVAGILQEETIVRVDKIPVKNQPVTEIFNSIHTGIGGDAYNEAIALKWLGDDVDFFTMIGKYDSPKIVNPPSSEVFLDTDYILPKASATPAAVVFYDRERNQQIFEDIKNLRDIKYDLSLFKQALPGADLVVLANANFCKPMLHAALEAGKKVAVNIRNFKYRTETYNEEFLEAADILYLSDDNIDDDPYDFCKYIVDKYKTEILIYGMGADGVLLYSNKLDTYVCYKPVKTNEIVNTVGAGNALFSCFLHYYNQTGDSTLSIRNALLFASYKIGFIGTSIGFMTEKQIEDWRELIWK